MRVCVCVCDPLACSEGCEIVQVRTIYSAPVNVCASVCPPHIAPWLNVIAGEITLLISLLPAALSLFSASPSTSYSFFVSPSAVCFHMSSSFTTYRSAPFFLILRFSWEALESGKGLNIRVNGVVLHFDTPHIISPSISLHGAEWGTFFLPASPPLTLAPYLPVIMCCRWEGIAAAQIALYLPIPSFLFYSFIDCPLNNKSEFTTA